MKRLLSFVVFALFSFAGIAHARCDSIVVENSTIETVVNDTLKARTGRVQWGVSARYGYIELAKIERSFLLSIGYRFNPRNYMGLNVGVSCMESRTNIEYQTVPYNYTGCPISLEYIHNFLLGKSKKHAIYLGGEMGFLFSFGQTYFDEGKEKKIDPFNFIMGKVGADFQLYKRLHLTVGIHVGVIGFGAGMGIYF